MGIKEFVKVQFIPIGFVLSPDLSFPRKPGTGISKSKPDQYAIFALKNFMNKTIFLGFVLLLSGCGSLPFFSEKERPPVSSGKPIDTMACQVDEDCVLVHADCCGCNSGGESIAVHKLQQEAYNRDLRKHCSSHRTICKAVYLCNEIQIRCKNSECVAVSKKP